MELITVKWVQIVSVISLSALFDFMPPCNLVWLPKWTQQITAPCE